MSKLKPVVALADFADERAVLVEFPEPRVRAAVVDEDVPLRICRDADGFAECLARRNLQKVWRRRVRNLRDILRGGFELRENIRGRRDRECNNGGQRGEQPSGHTEPPRCADSTPVVTGNSRGTQRTEAEEK